MKWKIFTGVVVFLIVAGIAASLYFVNQRNVTKLVERGERVNLLVMGLDYVGGTSRSDTMMLVSLVPDSEEVQLLSIPRDMFLKYPDGEFRRINAAYPIGGCDLARNLISDLLGLEIPFHAALDYQGFKELVDMIGGVEITVERRLKYEDTAATPPLSIDIKPGRQVLNGEEALGYIRYRGVGGSDIRRIQRQQKFLQALLDQGLQFQGWGEMKDLISTGHKYLQTNLSLVDLYDLGKMIRGISTEDLSTTTLPGKADRVGDKAVLQPQIVGIKRIVAEQIHGVDLLTKDDVNVLVLNGEGSAWLAHNFANQLKRLGFNVVGADNADMFDYKSSYVVRLTSDGSRKATMLHNAMEMETQVVPEGEFSDHLKGIRNAGVTIPDNTDLILVLGKGSTNYTT